ncbi:MAG: amino acid adenylation domain-containing protein [Clostridia bacterium]|nr:amino acid adenylation domain-containing protein [Clostridia bacterium]
MINSVVRLLDKAAEQYPDKTAVIDENSSVSYAKLQTAAKSVGTYLIQNSTVSGISPVIVYMKKSLKCLVSFMGILYSGNPYVPVAADMPISRIKKIVENLKPEFIITDEQGLENLSESDIEGVKPLLYEDIVKTCPDMEIVEKRVNETIDTDPVYIMYTSGSTGTPKGVVVSHKGVYDYVLWTSTEFGFTKDDIFGNQAPFYFDNSIFDIYGCLITGATLVIIPEVLFNFPLKLPEYVNDMNITVIFWVPTVMINIANSGVLETAQMNALKKVLFCGEVMPNTQLNIWRRYFPGLMYANLYGPTEITDVCTYYVVDREFKNSDPLPIGRACRNMRTIILTDDNKAAAVGECGELCIAGTGVSLGYWNNPEITDRAFVQNPLNDKYFERIYRTGDLAYYNEEGLIIFVGRKDSQIKIKGNRVELGEIENAAMCIDEIKGACAVFNAERGVIVLFVESDKELRLRLVNNQLKAYIPKYMLPGELCVMEKFPHTANDKIDRVALRKMTEKTGE